MNPTAIEEEIEKRAAEWILKRDRDGTSEEDRAALEAWLSQDARHREAYLELDELWDLTAGMRQWHPRDGRIDPDLLSRFSSRARQSNRSKMLLIAASIVALAWATGWQWLSMQRGESYSTPVGGYERIVLEDGSVLQLNTDTVVQARLTDSRRTVRLLRGEAYFDVAQDRQRPFEVTVGRTVARAVGTAFSVRAEVDGQLELMVTQGRVMLLPDGSEGKQPLITAGQSAQARNERVAIAPVDSREMSRRLAWQRGQLVFDRQPLSRVAAEFNRYNRRQVRIASEGLGSLRLTGNFKATDLDSFVAAIRSAADVRVEGTDRALVIRAQ